MECENFTDCPACHAKLRIVTDKEVFPRTTYIIEDCPYCHRKIVVSLSTVHGVQISISDKSRALILRVEMAESDKEIAETEQPLIEEKENVLNDNVEPQSSENTGDKQEPYARSSMVPEKLPYVKGAFRNVIFGALSLGCASLAIIPIAGFVFSAMGITFGLVAFISSNKLKDEFNRNYGKYRLSSLSVLKRAFVLGLIGFIVSIIMVFFCIATSLNELS